MIPPTILSVAALVAARAAKISGPPQHRTGRISNKRAAPESFLLAGYCVCGHGSPYGRSPARGLVSDGAMLETVMHCLLLVIPSR